MNILSINTYPNNNIAFQANPKIVLTKDAIKTMPVEDILELSSATLGNQDINIVRMIFSKISGFVKHLTSKYSYLKANEMNFPMKELEKTNPELASVLVPNCAYRCGCPEFECCGFWKKFEEYCLKNDVDVFDIKSRYYAYNEYFESYNKNKGE